MTEFPVITWIKNDRTLTQFEDGSRFLVAFRERDGWDFECVDVSCDGDGASLLTEGGDASEIAWPDVEYFHLVWGSMPTVVPPEEP